MNDDNIEQEMKLMKKYNYCFQAVIVHGIKHISKTPLYPCVEDPP